MVKRASSPYVSCPPVSELASLGICSGTASSWYVSCPPVPASIGVCRESSTSPYVSCLSVPTTYIYCHLQCIFKVLVRFFPIHPKTNIHGRLQCISTFTEYFSIIYPRTSICRSLQWILILPIYPYPHLSQKKHQPLKFVAYLYHPQMFLAHLKESRRKSAQQRKTKKTWTSQSSRISKLHIVPAVKHRLTIKVLFLLHHINICNHRSHPENIMHARTNNLIPSGLMWKHH